MNIDIKKCTDTQLWELLTDISTILKGKDIKDSMYIVWVKLFESIRKEIDKRLCVDYEK